MAYLRRLLMAAVYERAQYFRKINDFFDFVFLFDSRYSSGCPSIPQTS